MLYSLIGRTIPKN